LFPPDGFGLDEADDETRHETMLTWDDIIMMIMILKKIKNTGLY
jgi:hypothetical protein